MFVTSQDSFFTPFKRNILMISAEKVKAIPKIIIKGFTLSTSENVGAITLVKNTRLRFDVKSASCFN